MRVKPGGDEAYIKFLATQWKALNEAGKKDGLVLSYHVIQSAAANKEDWDMMLVTEYKKVGMTKPELWACEGTFVPTEPGSCTWREQMDIYREAAGRIRVRKIETAKALASGNRAEAHLEMARDAEKIGC